MTNDDILYAPIGNITPAHCEDPIIDQVRRALVGSIDIEFAVDPNVPIVIYDQIASIIEQDPSVIGYTSRIVTHQGVRPSSALTLKDVFRRLHTGIDEFWFCGNANSSGIAHYHFTNWFAITQKLPVAQIDTKNILLSNKFELWTLGLMGDFGGYHTYYSFGSNDDAYKYYGLP